MANITARPKKDGTISYRVRVSNGLRPDGSQNTVTTTITPPLGLTKRQTEKYVQQEANNFENRVLHGYDTRKITFEQLAKMYLEDVVKVQKASSVSASENRLKNAYPVIGSIEAAELKKSDIRNYISHLEQPRARTKGKGKNKQIIKYTLSATTVQAYLKAVSQVLSYGCEMDVLENNILLGKGIRKPKAENKDPKLIEDADRIKLFEAVSAECKTKYKALFFLLAVTGLRKGEALGLKWQNVDFENNTIEVEQGSYYVSGKGILFTEPKTKTSERTLKVSQAVMVLLRKWKTEQAEMRLQAGPLWQRNTQNTSEFYCENHDKCNHKTKGYCSHKCRMYQECERVFTSDNGSPMDPYKPNKILNKLCDKYDLPHTYPHVFRHTMVSTLIKQGVPITDIQSYAGHSSPKVTLGVYSHAFKDASDSCADVIAEAYDLKEVK
ncbi:MAG: site-specific integrase [Eubacteriaceae bacterium]|jgi:integrase|nr:site-specific integrase [Eubacteriaceae bacterium]